MDEHNCSFFHNPSVAPVLFCNLGYDDRLYLTAGILTAFVDSGAKISILGKRGLSLLPKLPFYSSAAFPLSVKTTDGASESILGQVGLPVSLNGVTRSINVLVVPSVNQHSILGIHFCKTLAIHKFQ